MGMMSIIEWCTFTGGHPLRKEHEMMLNYIKIVWKESGNATWWT
jgi:hypothetical protein